MIYLVLFSLLVSTRAIGPEGGIISTGGKGKTIVSLTIPQGSLKRYVPLEVKQVPPPPLSLWGWRPLRAFEIIPKWEVFKGPIQLEIKLKKGEEKVVLAYLNQDMLFPLASSKISGDHLKATLYHGGTYVLVIPENDQNLVAPERSKYALLVIGDLIIDDAFPRIEHIFREKGYRLPLWFFPLKPGENPLEASVRLSQELRKLHKEWGDFKLDVLALGLGGIAAVGYVSDTTLYNRDLGNAVVTIGTPYFGTSFASPDSAYTLKNPRTYFFVDVLGENSLEYLPQGRVVEFVKKNRGWGHRGGFSSELIEENLNSVSLIGRIPNPPENIYFPEVKEGDGFVSISSGMMTPLEPRPFPLDHFALLRSEEVLKIAEEFLAFYHGWNWPKIFVSVWKGELPEDTISTLWLKEAKLHFRSEANLEALLEWNRNLLASVPQNGILITNGDSDTYPGWFLQDKEGFRKDVLIVNRNLCWIKSYVDFLKSTKGLPLKESSMSLGDTLILDLLKKQNKRPVTFAISVYKPEKYSSRLELCGLVYRVGKSALNLRKTDSLLHRVYCYDAVRSVPADSISQPVERLMRNYQALLARVARAYEEKGKLQKALNEFDFATSFPKTSPSVWLIRGQLLEEMGKDSLAMGSYLEALEKAEDNWDIILACSRSLLKMGKKDAVFKAVSRFLYRHPGNKEALEFLKSL